MRAIRPYVLLFAMAAAWVAVPGIGHARTPTHLGSGPHLMVDDFLAARQSGLTRHVHACDKLPAPVLQSERPWEAGRVYEYGSVFPRPDAAGFQMWYMSRGLDMSKRDERLRSKGSDLVLYATSDDGRRWIRPDLQLFTFAGSRANNIVFAMHSPSVLFDPHDPDPACRYKMVGHLYEVDGKPKRGYCAAHSPDGLHWSLYPTNPILPGGDTITLSYNPRTSEYLVFYKNQARVGAYMRRSVMLATSKDMQHWRDHGLVLAPDEQDDHWVKHEPQRTEFYNMSVFPRGDQFLGLVTVFRLEEIRDRSEVGRDQSRHDGPIDVQLAHSRDAVHWHRCDDRAPVIPRGPHAYDAGSILGVSNIPVFHDKRMWVYYTAMTTTHGGAIPQKKMSIGRASWPIDRMASLDAGVEEGILETVPLQFDGKRLTVNADAAAGQLVVELLDRAGHPLPGYSAKDCRPTTSDDVQHVIHWSRGPQLPAERPLRIRFRLRNARLYAFSFGQGHD